MTDKEEQIAFKQWVKDWGYMFGTMSKESLWLVYRSMDEENRKEFLDEARRNT